MAFMKLMIMYFATVYTCIKLIQHYFNDMYLCVSFMQQIPQRDMWLPSNSDDNPIKSSSGALQVDGLDLQ